MPKILGSDIKKWCNTISDDYYFEGCNWTLRENADEYCDGEDYDFIVERDQMYDLNNIDGYVAREDGNIDPFCKPIKTHLRNYLKSRKMTVFSVECDKSQADEVIAYLQNNGCIVRR
jgi:hypothetical protein